MFTRLSTRQIGVGKHYRRNYLAIAILIFFATATHPRAQTRVIDVDGSSITVQVFKSGLFSAFADNHVIKAPIASGTIADQPPLAIAFSIRAGELRVIDPTLSADRRAEVQSRMLGPDVLDTSQFPEITFASTGIQPAAADRWRVTGQLNLHGRSQSISVDVARVNGKYRGDVALRQRDFGIEPIRIAGGTVRVKDEIKVQFEIAARPAQN